jgi:dipeptidyl-peptidase 4
MSCPSRPVHFASVLTLSVVAVAPLAAQGTRTDYQRANHLHEATRGKVFKLDLLPHWLDDDHFWYCNELAGGAREYVLVDAQRGTRAAAFDHARLAAALEQATRKHCDPRRLPIESLSLPKEAHSLVVWCDGRAWRCDLTNYKLTEAKDAQPPTLRPLRAAGISIDGPRAWLTLINRSLATVEIFWINRTGQREHYASLKPGEQYRSYTYAGHVWLAAKPDGRELAMFQAEPGSATAVIDERFRPHAKTPRHEHRQPVSPDGRWRAVFKDHNLYLHNEADGSERALTDDGTADDQYDGDVYWSPDSRKLVAFRTAKGDDRRVYYVESSPPDQLQPILHSYAYLKPGDRLPHPRPQLFDVPAARHIPLNEELWPNPWSISELRWENDSQRFTFLYNQRGHQVLRVVAIDAATSRATAVIDERSPTFIDYSGKYFCNYLDATREIVWMSERDGWNHLYLVDATSGRIKNQVTKGPWVVRRVEKIDPERRQIWFYAGGIRPEQDPYYLHYCRVNFDGTGLIVLTAGDGTHHVQHSPDGRYLLDSWARVDRPPVHELRRAADGSLVCRLEEADWSALLALPWRAPERFVAKGRDGKTDIYGVIFRPSNFDPQKRYPVIEDIYAGPHDSFVPKAFAPFYAAQALAELGLVVVKIDGMGTSNRSKTFHDVCWKNLVDAGFPDRILWIRAAAAKYPALDISRVGIYGGSAGGQSALAGLLTHGDFYKAAVADCGCHDNRMDKVWWNEQWMGWPIGPHYREQSNVTLAPRLTGKLLLVVGEKDENVDPATTMQVVNALVKADKDFELLVVPGAGHGACESPYGVRRRADFFVRNLLGVEPRTQP